MAACDVWKQTHKHFKNALVQESIEADEETHSIQWNNNRSQSNSLLLDELVCNSISLNSEGNSIDSYDNGQVNLSDCEFDSDEDTVYGMLSCDEDKDKDENHFENTYYNCIPIWEWERQQQHQQCDTHRVIDRLNSSNDASLPVQNSINSKKLDEKNNDWCSMSFSFKKNTGESGGSDNTYENENENENENNTNNISNEKDIQLQLYFPDNCLLNFCHLDAGIVLYSEIIKLIENLLQSQNLDKYHIILCDDLISFVNSNDKIDYTALSKQTRMENKWNNDIRIIFFSQVMKILLQDIPVDVVFNDITNWNGYHVINEPQKGNICEINNKTNKINFNVNNNLSSLNSQNNRIYKNYYKKKRGRKKKRYKWIAKNHLQNPKMKNFFSKASNFGYYCSHNNGGNSDSTTNDDCSDGSGCFNGIHCSISNNNDCHNVSTQNISIDNNSNNALNGIFNENNIVCNVTARVPPFDPDIMTDNIGRCH